jgi:hypothetical protein
VALIASTDTRPTRSEAVRNACQSGWPLARSTIMGTSMAAARNRQKKPVTYMVPKIMSQATRR